MIGTFLAVIIFTLLKEAYEVSNESLNHVYTGLLQANTGQGGKQSKDVNPMPSRLA